MYRFTFCNLIFLHIPCISSHKWRAEPSSSTPLLFLVALRTYLYPIITTRSVTRRALTFNCSPSHLGGCTSCPRIGPLLAVLRSSSPLRCSSACHINRLPGLHSRSAPLHFNHACTLGVPPTPLPLVGPPHILGTSCPRISPLPTVLTPAPHSIVPQHSTSTGWPSL